MRIEVAKALEGAIPDLAAKHIIDGGDDPAFRAGDFAGGLNAAIDHLASRIKGEALPLPDEHRSTRKARALNWEQWLIFALVGIPCSTACSVPCSVARGRSLHRPDWRRLDRPDHQQPGARRHRLGGGVHPLPGFRQQRAWRLGRPTDGRRLGGGGWGGGSGGGGFSSGGGATSAAAAPPADGERANRPCIPLPIKPLAH